MVHSIRTFSSRTWFTVGAIGIVLLVAFAFVREYVRNIDIATELARMESENAALNTQHLASLQLISQLSTETAVEAEARTKLNLAKEGETLYVIEDKRGDIDKTGDSLKNTDQYLAEDPALSNPIKWFYYFFIPASGEDSGTL